MDAREDLERKIMVAHAVQSSDAEIAELEKRQAALSPQPPVSGGNGSGCNMKAVLPPPVPIKRNLRHIRLEVLPPEGVIHYHELMEARTKHLSENNSIAVADIEKTLLVNFIDSYTGNQLRSGIEPDFSKPFVNDTTRNF